MDTDGYLHERYAGVRVLVLGGAGFIGRWVSRALSSCGARTQIAARDRSAANAVLCEYTISAEIVELDLRDARAVRELVRRSRPSIVFNLAGYGVDRSERDEYTAYRINAFLVSSLCEALADNRDPEWSGQRLVHVGSALEYGTVDGNLAEDSAHSPTTLYGQSKLAGTYLLVHGSQTHGTAALTARLFTVYGPGEHQGRLLPSLLTVARTNQPLPLTAGTQRRDFVFVEDVAEGLLRLGLTRAEPGQIVNLATGTLTSVRTFVETAATVLGIPSERLLFGAISERPEEMAHSEVSIERLEGLTGWRPTTTIAEGIRRTRDLLDRLGGGEPATDE